MNCSSSPVPRVATTSACVSPRVNSAEPWVRGRTPTSATIGRTVVEVAAVDAGLGVEHVPAHDLGLEVVDDFAERFARDGAGLDAGGEGFLDLGLGGIDGGVAGLPCR